MQPSSSSFTRCVASAIMLVGILAVYLRAGARTFNILAIAEQANFDPRFAFWAFLAFFFGFAVKVPVWPFHTWLAGRTRRGAHARLDDPGRCAAEDGRLRLLPHRCCPRSPMGAFRLQGRLGACAVISIIYGALAAMAQTDLKKMVAYSSISHMGFVFWAAAGWSPPGRRRSWQLMRTARWRERRGVRDGLARLHLASPLLPGGDASSMTARTPG